MIDQAPQAQKTKCSSLPFGALRTTLALLLSFLTLVLLPSGVARANTPDCTTAPTDGEQTNCWLSYMANAVGNQDVEAKFNLLASVLQGLLVVAIAALLLSFWKLAKRD